VSAPRATHLHGTKEQVHRQFETIERPALMSLPRDPFAMFHEARRTVSRDGHLDVDKAFYSAPPEYITRRVVAGDFIRKHHDPILIGPPGVGKSYLVQSIGLQLIRHGFNPQN
jgi:hypothetical protein